MMIRSSRLKQILNAIIRFMIYLVGFGAIYLPVILIFIFSINKQKAGTEFTGLTLKWYMEIFTDRNLLQSILNTLLVAITTTIFASIIGTLASIGMNALSVKKRQSMMLLNNIPVLNSEVVTGISMMLLFSLLIPLFPDIFGFFTMTIAHIFFTVPYVILSVMPKLRETDESLFEASLDLGVSPYRSLYKVIIPSIKTGIFTGALLAFTMSIDDFVISYFTTGNGFTNISNYIYPSIGRNNFTPATYAFNSLLTIITFIIVIVFYLKGKKGVKTK